MRIAFPVSVIATLVLAVAGTAFAAIGITYPKGPDPAVTVWPSWPYPTACEELAFDPVAVFGGPTGAEQGSGAPEVALEKYLHDGPYPYLPKRFWRLVASTETRVAFSSGRLAFGLTWLDFRLVDGVWTAVGSPGHCRPRTTREGAESLHWRLGSDRPGAVSRRVQIEVTGVGGCGSAAAPSSLRPEFHQVGRRLLLTVWHELSPGPRCMRRLRSVSLAVGLPGRLGDRELWDGSVYPPRRVS